MPRVDAPPLTSDPIHAQSLETFLGFLAKVSHVMNNLVVTGYNGQYGGPVPDVKRRINIFLEQLTADGDRSVDRSVDRFLTFMKGGLPSYSPGTMACFAFICRGGEDMDVMSMGCTFCKQHHREVCLRVSRTEETTYLCWVPSGMKISLSRFRSLRLQLKGPLQHPLSLGSMPQKSRLSSKHSNSSQEEMAGRAKPVKKSSYQGRRQAAVPHDPHATATGDASQPLTVRCQCGRVAFTTPTAAPLALWHCHCKECRKQSGSAFGTSAIFPADGMFPLSSEVESKIKKYTRDTDKGDTMDCYFCTECGSRLFHRIVGKDGPRPTVSIKGGCIEGLDWSGGRHIYVRSAVMKIPDEWETYETVPPKML
ncbi:Mss4-like protein [Xylaria cubensis]|nr:Mss4-like protein [Xylaria cubensis]